MTFFLIPPGDWAPYQNLPIITMLNIFFIWVFFHLCPKFLCPKFLCPVSEDVNTLVKVRFLRARLIPIFQKQRKEGSTTFLQKEKISKLLILWKRFSHCFVFSLLFTSIFINGDTTTVFFLMFPNGFLLCQHELDL